MSSSSAGDRPAKIPKPHWGFAALLASLAMLGPFSIDTYLPAFPAIGAEFGATPIALQQTLSAYLFAYAFMMLWHGALSDAIGRRPVIIGGLAIYAVATLGCAIAGNIESLWLFRALQGFSAGTGLVIGRAVIRDRFHGPDAQRLMSRITLMFSIAPAIAPVVGGVLLNTFGWRSIFWVTLAWVVAIVVWCARSLPETLGRANRQPLHPRILWRNYRSVLSRVEFLLLALIPTLNFSAFFIYVACAPTFLIELLGVSTYGFAWLFLPMIAGIVLGATISGRTAGRVSPKLTIRLGYAFMGLGALCNVLICAFVAPAIVWNVLPIMIFAIGSAIVMPSVTLILLDMFPSIRGLASSLQGFVQFGFSAVNAGTIAPLLAHSLLALAWGMAGFAIASLACWLTYQRLARPTLKAWKP